MKYMIISMINWAKAKKSALKKNFAPESYKTLKDIEILHDTLPYKNKQVEAPIGMKQRILESVLNEDKTSGKDIKSENQEEDFNSTNSKTNN